MVNDIHHLLRTHWGYASFRPLQEPIIRDVLAGKDTLALLPTGGGKSLCFQVPAVALGGTTIVISPLIALMHDQVMHARARGITAAALTSAMTPREIDNVLEDAAQGRFKLFYIAPERIGTELFQARARRIPVELIVVDEAHCISQWGYDFRPAYQRIADLRPLYPKAPVLALTATATADVVADIQDRLAFRGPNVRRGPFHRPELTFWVARGEDKHGRLLRIATHTEGSGIIYVRERRMAHRMAGLLEQHGVPTGAYHAGLSHEERDHVQAEWMSGRLRWIAATNAFGMGIDKGDVRVVVHLAPPPDPESYYQEAGRAGRDGRDAHAILLVDARDADQLRKRVQESFPTLAQVRRVYQGFADMHHIAIGAGRMESYPLDVRALADRTGERPAMVMNALKALELDGTIALSEGARSPSRIRIIAPPSTVHAIRLQDARKGSLLEALLRLYGGLYEEPTIVEEERIARVLGKPLAQVRSLLKELHAQDVIDHRPRNDSPLVTLFVPRRDAAIMMLDRNALSDRRARASYRAEAMIAYFDPDAPCREQQLLAYFGGSDPTPCGRCDRCRQRARASGPGPLDTSDLAERRWAIDQGS
ncbi:MAG: RecQ family ATP-dependent DNA helicase [Flavobacteriales bacterium]|nr:RecQ family ATP-dependent DNA helicase [Flavobacteriales bacterium]MCB9168018.1 RecQ family ATP-dependent DNA helicase [Flavobacteriales bacterium]